MATTPVFHSDIVMQQWQHLDALLGKDKDAIALDGCSLDIAQIVSIARYGKQFGSLCKMLTVRARYRCKTRIDEPAYESLVASLNALQTRLAGGEIIYGTS